MISGNSFGRPLMLLSKIAALLTRPVNWSPVRLAADKLMVLPSGGLAAQDLGQ
jgi:hypothetical protein